MCGIIGLFLKDKALEPQLGRLLSDMLVVMSDRGPDSAGIAVYGDGAEDEIKITLQSATPEASFGDDLGPLARNDSHAVLSTKSSDRVAALSQIQAREDLRIMSVGERVEIYKEVGLPGDVATRFGIDQMRGSHGIGHTRMATESAVTTLGAHPFSTGSDQCLVHNGSLSNHNNLRRKLIHQGYSFETENDTEVGAADLTARMDQGRSLGEALEDAIEDLDGFYTFVVGTKNGFGVLRDPIACKPAVLAETDQYVAFGSEYRALVGLPGIESAKVWEPEPATVYFWEH